MEADNNPMTALSSLGLGGLDLMKIMELLAEYGPKIKGLIPKLVELFPKIKEWEKTNNLKENEMILYSAMATSSNIFIYVNKVYQNENKEVILSEQIHKFDLMELINKYSSYIPG